ncbi:uncharacterized protein LOC6641885 [Drosophila willistoni]|uniref:uncharacterized protein LOC6641885 n=1 Tax=Drosophila willistoni TaxID=7260 RepID=UPI001F0764F6|nr:uncharacterized protein LOC6641885 [Drosophila willistoni]
MEQRANFLALILLDALEDENETDIFEMLEKNGKTGINASLVILERGLAPLHYVCGMRNEKLAERILDKFLENPQLDANVRCDGQMTPLHIASMYGRVELVRMLLKRGKARPDLADDENKLPVHYAIEECHFEVLQLLRDHIFQEKQKQREKKQKLQVPNQTSTPNGEGKLKYNYDTTSPYYINITHRRHKVQPVYPDEAPSPMPEAEESVNLFSLTREHLSQKVHSSIEHHPSRRSLIESWREKVERSRARQSLLQQYDDHVEQMVDEALTKDDFNYAEHVHRKLREEQQAEEERQLKGKEQELQVSKSRELFEHLVEQVSQAKVVEPENSFQTAQDALENDNNDDNGDGEQPQSEQLDSSRTGLIRSPRQDDYFLQMTEAYVHTDDENGLVFYETKLLQNGGTKVANQRAKKHKEQEVQLDSTVSTNLTIPVDYETDALRAELTQLGAPLIGPITKTTKRLYIKQLIKYRRNTEALLKAQKHAEASQIKYSVELHRTLKSPQDFQRISDYMPQLDAHSQHFNTSNAPKKPVREGHLKQSFIYMLIDPLISRNLPGESAFLDKFSIWQRFLDSIFYIGKGKSSRPYAHLYDAMRQHTRLHQQKRRKEEKLKKPNLNHLLQSSDIFKSPTNDPATSKKLQRILDIWSRGSGVVCLHVFHNIMPIDAYTREASMIDAIGLLHLSNLKRGDYYGPAQSWTMKQKKQLGIALLFKAMHIYLAEGESQLSPSDLI